MTDITDMLLDFSGDNIGQYMPAVQPMPVGVLMKAVDEIKELRAALAEETQECNAQANLVATFANRWEREVALCDSLADVLKKLADGTVMGVHMGKTFAGQEWIAPALERYEEARRG